ncbi:hypothetical protein MANES_02G044476v8 [Manihot esculenta]|uniref:Uncharacterized protein n=1 Tax=Manihot esculenta TaxID=3983 RepID=A0A2C9WDH8_MANES|nr:hypothetical protein MANES_02G044476v8 [Manihot esculenta]
MQSICNANLKTSWIESNSNKRFYGCRNYGNRNYCGFFQWIDESFSNLQNRKTAAINSRVKKLLIIATCCKFYIIFEKIVIGK